MSNLWNSSKAINYFNNNRNKFNHLYFGEKFLLKNFLFENCSILDIGCAQAGLSKIIKKNILNNFNYTGADSSTEMINLAKKCKKHNFYLIKDNNLNSIKKKFDVVIILGILHLNKNWRNILSQAKKLTKKFLIFDLRTSIKETVEDINKSYFTFEKHSRKRIPYNIINILDCEFFLNKKFKKQEITELKYSGKPSNFSFTPYKKIFL